MSIDDHTENMKRWAARVAARRFKGPRQTSIPSSYFNLLRDLQGIVDFDAEVTDGALELGVAEQKLDGPQVLGPLVDQRRLRPPHEVLA